MSLRFGPIPSINHTTIHSYFSIDNNNIFLIMPDGMQSISNAKIILHDARTQFSCNNIFAVISCRIELN